KCWTDSLQGRGKGCPTCGSQEGQPADEGVVDGSSWGAVHALDRITLLDFDDFIACCASRDLVGVGFSGESGQAVLRPRANLFDDCGQRRLGRIELGVASVWDEVEHAARRIEYEVDCWL